MILVRDKKTLWSWREEPLAQQTRDRFKKGPHFSYHTGMKRRTSALPRPSAPNPDSADGEGELYAVDVVPVKKLRPRGP